MATDDDDALEKLQRDLESWRLDQQLDVAAEVYDPKRRNIHELEGEEMLDRFRSMLGFDVSWEEPQEPQEPPPTGEAT